MSIGRPLGLVKAGLRLWRGKLTLRAIYGGVAIGEHLGQWLTAAVLVLVVTVMVFREARDRRDDAVALQVADLLDDAPPAGVPAETLARCRATALGDGRRGDLALEHADVPRLPAPREGRQYLLFIVNDITMRKKMEQALKDSESKYQMILITVN